jgi:ribulose-5-phosphate 4-epimerase/fuculose-1-phosphate aldolase
LTVADPAPAGLVESLVRAGEAVVRAGLVVGSGGNLSARAPGADTVRVTAAGAWLDRLEPSTLLPSPWATGALGVTSEFALHGAVYRVRPDINAVIHLHPQITVLLDSLGEQIRLITTDHLYYVRRVGVTPFHPPGTQALADAVAEAVADGTDCVILPHHGCAVLADSVDLALRRALNLEEAARLTYQALMLTGAVSHRPIVECPGSYDHRYADAG